ncbi:MAG: DUF2752 domain-containing protein [Armatimonadota bacterium]
MTYAVVASFPAFLLLVRFVPFDRLPPTCAFLALTRYPCPLCGMTRSVMAIVRFDLASAVRFNPLGPVFLFILGICWVNAMCECAGKRTRLSAWAKSRYSGLVIAAFLALILFGAIRILLLQRGIL